MVNEESPDHLDGKKDQMRKRTARRVGETLSLADLPAAERLAAEALARELVANSIEHVRHELSFAVRQAPDLPKDIGLRLAYDLDSVSVPFLEVTKIFSESEWLQLLLTVSQAGRMTIAARDGLTENIAIRLAEIDDAAVVDALIENPDAPISEQVCHVVIERFEDATGVLVDRI